MLVLAVHVAVVAVSVAGPLLILADTFSENGHFTLNIWRSTFADLGSWTGLLHGRWAVLLGNTARVAGITLAACLPTAFLLAFMLFKTNLRDRPVLLAVLLFIATMPLYVVTGAALSFIRKENWMEWRSIVGLIHALAHLPIVALVLGVALRSIDADLEETALMEGAGPAAMLRLRIRLAIGGIIAAAVILLLWVTTDYSVSDVFMVRTFPEEVYTQYALHARPEEPSLVCVPPILLFGGMLWVLRRGLFGSDVSWERGGRTLIRRLRWPGAASLAVGGLLAAWIGLLVYSMLRPIVHERRPGEGIGRYFTLFSGEIQTSLWTSLTAGVLAGLLAVGLAWYVVRRPRWRKFLAGYIVLMLAFPAPLIGMGLIRIFNHEGILGSIHDSPAILVLAWVIRFLPVAVLVLLPAIRAIPAECEQAAEVDGCGRFDVWARVVLPQCVPSVLVAAFLVMVLAIGELPCSVLVAPPGYDTIGVRFFSLIHYGLYADAAALCILSMLMVFVPAVGLVVVLRKRLDN